VHFLATPVLDFVAVQDWKGVMNIRVGSEYKKDDLVVPRGLLLRPDTAAAREPGPAPARQRSPRDHARARPSLGPHHRRRVRARHHRADRSTEGENRDGYDGTYSNSTFTLGVSLGVAWP
jgi:hypothetical protein